MTTSPFAFDWVEAHARLRPDAPAIGTPASWTTYGELALSMRRLAWLLEEAGVGPGAFVLVALPAGPAAVAGVLAIQSLGACAVEINRELDARSVTSILDQTRARHALVHGRDLPRWADLAKGGAALRLLVTAPSPLPARAQELLRGCDWRWIDEKSPGRKVGGERSATVREPAAPALVVYTSGSTGVPRGVVQSHANLDANTRAICRYLQLGPADRALSILPLFYCYGRSILNTHLLVGGSVFFDNRFMYPRVVMEAIREQACTGFYGVPLTFEILRRQVDLRTLDLQTLRYVAQAGGAMAPATIRWVRESFHPAPLYVMYGQTEATARLSYLPPERAREKEGSIGRGLDNVELRIVDPRGNELPPGEVGELIARGPSITAGYLGCAEETAAILREGWLWTGDLGWRDEEGFIFLVGRSREMLKLGGHRVSPAEIEQVLLDHPAIREAAVVGAPDPTGGEAAVAFVVGTGSAALDPNEVRRFCRERLPAFKVPREVHVEEALPRTPSGKIARADLRGRLAK